MSTTAVALGAAHEFAHGGKVYQVRLVDQDVKIAFQKYLLRKAKEALAGFKDCYTPEEYRAGLESLRAEYEQGGFDFVSPRTANSLQTYAGMLHLVTLIFGVDEAEALSLLATAREEVNALVETVLRESFPFMGKEWQEEGKKKADP